MADLCVGPGGNPFTAYVAFTRVQGRNKLLIFRPFDAAPFQKGVGLGRGLLLRQLRGERIDWKALLAKYCEERPCSECPERKQACAFTRGQWNRGDKDRVCRECTNRRAAAGTPWQCNVCKTWHVETHFPHKHRQRQCSFYRVCLTCEAKKVCSKCKIQKPETDFGLAAWKARHADRRICRTCATKERGSWVCNRCRCRQPTSEFNVWQRRRVYIQDGTQTCNQCELQIMLNEAARRARERLAPLRRRAKARRCEAALEKVRAEIHRLCAQADEERRARKRPTSEPPSLLRAPHAAAEKMQPTFYEYTCPFCQNPCRSQVHTGQVEHRAQCGHVFRVRDGSVSGRIYEHVCPKCGTTVPSSKASGRIRVRHKNRSGRQCPCESWQSTGPTQT